MRISVQTDRLETLTEALTSDCDKVRFGSEFCEWKIPSLSELKDAYKISKYRKKKFGYITPRVSKSGLKKIIKQLKFLNEKGEIDIIINDLGVLNILSDYHELNPYLGRQLVHIPARSPWLMNSPKKYFFLRLLKLSNLFDGIQVENLYSQTSLNYPPTIHFYKEHGVQGIDLDWIPRCFSYYNLLMDAGLNISIHFYLVPITITRKCHIARFFDEKSPENCSRPCNKKTFFLKRSELKTELFLHGNVVFRYVKPSNRNLKKLSKNNSIEFVIDMNPITKTLNNIKIDELINFVRAT